MPKAEGVEARRTRPRQEQRNDARLLDVSASVACPGREALPDGVADEELAASEGSVPAAVLAADVHEPVDLVRATHVYLVHVRLFGGSYGDAVESILSRFGV